MTQTAESTRIRSGTYWGMLTVRMILSGLCIYRCRLKLFEVYLLRQRRLRTLKHPEAKHFPSVTERDVTEWETSRQALGRFLSSALCHSSPEHASAKPHTRLTLKSEPAVTKALELRFTTKPKGFLSYTVQPSFAPRMKTALTGAGMWTETS